ncbi:hypothetical protein ACTXT7_000999 [Hymenolepis weldensis]
MTLYVFPELLFIRIHYDNPSMTAGIHFNAATCSALEVCELHPLRRIKTLFTRRILLVEEILGFLKGTVGQFRVYYVKNFDDPEELLSAVLVDDANVFVVNVKQESALKILQTAQIKNILQQPFYWLIFNGGVTLAENDLNVQNANFFAIELSPNGNLSDYAEFATVPKPITPRDLIFRDTVVFALKALAEQLNKQANGSVSATFQDLKSPPSAQEVLTMMQSRTLRLGTVVVPPLITTEVDVNGRTVPKGPEIAVAKELMKRLNLSYEIAILDSPVGEKTDDGWTGLFRYIAEWDLDMLVGPFSITPNRSTDFQTSTPVRSISYTFIYRRPSLSKHNQIFQFVVAFDAVTWALIFVTAVLVGVSLAVLHKINPGNTSYTLHLSMLFVFGYLFQGVRTRPPTYASSQILIVVWWLFCLILVIAFCANYAAYRSSIALENLPNSLVTLLHQNYYKYSYIRGSNMGYSMSIPLDSVIYSLYQVINTKFKDMIPNNREEGINEVIKGQFALLDESPFNDYNAKKYCLESGPSLWFGAYVFFMPKQLPYGAIIDEEIKTMGSDGTLDKIYKSEENIMMSTLPTYCGATFKDQALEAMRIPLINWSDYSVEFSAAFGIFIVSLLGLLIVLIILLVEYLLGIYKKVILKRKTIIKTVIIPDYDVKFDTN